MQFTIINSTEIPLLLCLTYKPGKEAAYERQKEICLHKIRRTSILFESKIDRFSANSISSAAFFGLLSSIFLSHLAKSLLFLFFAVPEKS